MNQDHLKRSAAEAALAYLEPRLAGRAKSTDELTRPSRGGRLLEPLPWLDGSSDLLARFEAWEALGGDTSAQAARRLELDPGVRISVGKDEDGRARGGPGDGLLRTVEPRIGPPARSERRIQVISGAAAENQRPTTVLSRRQGSQESESPAGQGECYESERKPHLSPTDRIRRQVTPGVQERGDIFTPRIIPRGYSL